MGVVGDWCFSCNPSASPGVSPREAGAVWMRILSSACKWIDSPCAEEKRVELLISRITRALGESEVRSSPVCGKLSNNCMGFEARPRQGAGCGRDLGAVFVAFFDLPAQQLWVP